MTSAGDSSFWSEAMSAYRLQHRRKILFLVEEAPEEVRVLLKTRLDVMDERTRA